MKRWLIKWPLKCCVKVEQKVEGILILTFVDVEMETMNLMLADQRQELQPDTNFGKTATM